MSSSERQPADGRIVFTARDDAGNEFALVLYDEGTTGVLRNRVPFGERCSTPTAERCVRLLLQSISAAAADG
jgi:hypothetical protein